MRDSRVRTIGYVLKGFPRVSEIFIASEIERLEALGLQLRLFVIKPGDADVRHAVVDRVRARPEYLPESGSVSEIALVQWLAIYLRGFLPALRRTLRRRPVATARAAAAALHQAVRARRGRFDWPRKVYLKEFLQAVAVADRVLDDPTVAHLHAHFCHGATTVTWLAATIAGLPFSFTAHAKDIYCDSFNPAGLLPRKLRAARFAVTCTDANRRHLAPMASGTPVHRIYHGLNADFSRLVARHRSNGTRRDRRVLAVGRLVRKKGFDLLVDACAALDAPDWRVVIVGEEGDQSNELRRVIRARGLSDRVQLVGAMGQDDLHQQYEHASVFCLPCRVADDGDRDGIPNVLIEAMACAVPVVTTPVSGIPELVVDGVNGLLVSPDDPNAVAAALTRLDRDPALARRLGRAAQATVREHFDGNRLAAELATLFREAVA